MNVRDKSIAGRKRSRLQRNFAAMQREGQGVWQFFIVHQQEVPALLARALAGEPLAQHVLRIIGSTLARLRAPGPALLCLLCDHQFHPGPGAVLPAAFAGVYAAVDDPGAAVVNGLCGICAATLQPELGERVLAFYRRHAGMTDMRTIDIAAVAGHG